MIILIIEHKDGKNEIINNLYSVNVYKDRIITWLNSENEYGMELGNIYIFTDIKEYIISNSLEDNHD